MQGLSDPERQTLLRLLGKVRGNLASGQAPD
jgi:hypothetical protein